MPARPTVSFPHRTNPFQVPARGPRSVSLLPSKAVSAARALSGPSPLVTPLPYYLPPVRPPAPTLGGVASRLVEPWPGPAGLGGDGHDTE